MDQGYLASSFGVATIGEIRWAHAVNSKSLLDKALRNDDVHFIETDVNLSEDGRIVMSHDAAESDLSFEDLLDAIQVSNQGLKLDFKHPKAVKPALKKLHQRSLAQPLIVNADILAVQGAPAAEIDGRQFIELCKRYCPEGLLSLGWRTTSGAGSRYKDEDIEAMLTLCRELSSVTFPVRASMLPDSWEAIQRLIGENRTLTIWDNEAVSDTLQVWLRINTDPRDCFYDIRLV